MSFAVNHNSTLRFLASEIDKNFLGAVAVKSHQGDHGDASGGGNRLNQLPIGSMYGIFTYIWLKFKINVGKYTIHGW